MFKKPLAALLILIPLVFLVIGLSFDRTKYGTDPESAYLLNGLNIASGKAVGHYDNPGTTVQIYSALVLRTTHIFRFNGSDFQTDVLQNSEYYIEILRKGFIILNSIIIMVLGLFVYNSLKNIWAGLALQLAPFLSVTLLEECFTKVAPEQFLFTAMAVFIMLILKFQAASDPGRLKYSWMFGLLAGFGLATKLTFLPVLIIPFIILKGQRNKWIYVLSVFPSFILFTLPAAKGYLNMAGWFLNLGTHTGTYGQGDSGFIDPSKYFSSIISIAVNNKSLVAVMCAAAILLIAAYLNKTKLKNKNINNEALLLLALLMAQAGSILMVAKHYHSNHYLFPALCLTGFLLVVMYQLAAKWVQVKDIRLVKLSLPATMAGIIVVSLLNIPYLSLAYQGYRMSNQSTDETSARLERDYKDFVKVYYYPGSFNKYSSLRWGNVYSRQYSSEMLMKLFPEGLFYNAWDKSFQLWETNIPAKEFLKKYSNRILLVGGPMTTAEFTKVEQDGLKLKKLFDSRVQAVYQIDIPASEIFGTGTQSSDAVWSLQTDLELLSTDGKWILANDSTQFCANASLAAGKARSGKSAFMMPATDSYAMAYELKDVKPGNKFDISIWKSAGSTNAYLVASGVNDPFYRQSNGYIESDKSGWQKVVLDLQLPADFKGNKLKIYLWNHSDSPVWFDDFMISSY